jgi:hypothetical protein
MGAALTLLIVGATFLSAGIVASSASFTIAFLTTVSAAVAASDSTGTAVTSTDAEVPDIVASSVAASDALVTTAAAVITGTFVTVASIPAATASFSVINIGNGAGCKDDNIAAINGRRVVKEKSSRTNTGGDKAHFSDNACDGADPHEDKNDNRKEHLGAGPSLAMH